MPAPKILYYDIETAPNLGYIWAKYEQNVLAYEREWYMLCISYRWAHEKKTHVVSLLDFPELYANDSEDDTEVVKVLWHLLDEADITIAHNGDGFDNKKSNARFIINGLNPPSPFRSIDTLKVARNKFKFNSNTLGDLGGALGLGEKVATGGFSLWQGVMRGDEKAWKRMIKYAKQDTDLLVAVYERLKPWMTNHPNHGVYTGEAHTCPGCGSEDLIRRGFKYTQAMTYQQWHCPDCGTYSRSRKAEDTDRPTLVP